MCGDATPDGSGLQVLLSLSRLNRVHRIDLRNNTLMVKTGCVLHKVTQQHDGHNIKLDMAVPVSSVAAFIDEVQPLLHAA